MAANCKISCSPVLVGFLVFCLTFNGVLSIKTQVRDADIFSLSVGGLKDFEFVKYELVVLTPQVRHFVIGTRVRRCFVTGVTRYPNSVSTLDVPKLVLCGDIETNPGPDHSSSATSSSVTLVMSAQTLFAPTRRVFSVMVVASGFT